MNAVLMRYLKYSLVLCLAALGGWVVNLWLFAHPGVSGLYPAKEKTAVATPPPTVYYLPGPQASQAQSTAPEATPPESPLVRKPLPLNPQTSVAANVTQAPARSPVKIPEEVLGIIDQNDWPYVRSALIVANNLGQHTKMVWWSNHRNGHKGGVVLTGAAADNRGCHQFRVTRMAATTSGGTEFAHVNVCRDGSIL